MAKRAKLNRSDAENIAIRAQVDAYIAQGLPLDQAQAVAFKDYAAGRIRVQSSLAAAASIAGLIANQARKRKASRQREVEADITAGRRYPNGRKKSTNKRK